MQTGILIFVVFLMSLLGVYLLSTTIASFAYGGASSINDIPFLKNSLLPAKLKQVEKEGTTPAKAYLNMMNGGD